MARKTILTNEMITQFDAVSTGLPERYSAELIGVCQADVTNWKLWGLAARKKKKSKRTANGLLYMAFLEQLEKARTLARLSRIQHIQKAGQGGSWQADAWWLERMCPESFGRPVVAMNATTKDASRERRAR